MACAVQALTHYQTYLERPPGGDLPPKKVNNLDPMAPRSTALLGGEDSAEARAERAEAKVAALMEKVAELNATVGELKGENKVLREHSERLFAMLEARPKQ